MARNSVSIVVDGRALEVDAGRPLLNAIMNAGLIVATACGGRGSCHLCRVTISDGAEHLPAPNSIEYKALGNVLIARGMRLSCQVMVERPMVVRLPVIETPEQRQARIDAARARRERKEK